MSSSNLLYLVEGRGASVLERKGTVASTVTRPLLFGTGQEICGVVNEALDHPCGPWAKLGLLEAESSKRPVSFKA